jgi:superfamily II helicase
MVDAMTADYMVYAYPGDVRSFLDDAVRTLDAVEALAEVEGNDEVADRARERRRALL